MKNKTILFVCTSLRKGGAGKMVNHVAGLLTSDYKSVYVVNVGKEEPFSLNNGVHYLSPLNEHKGGLMGFVRTIRAIRHTLKIIKPDVCVSFVSDVAVCTQIASLGLHDSITVSAERGDPYSLNLLWKYLVSWAYKRSDYCFFQLEKARDFFGESVEKKSFVIPNAAFIDYLPGLHSAKNKTIVGAGRFVKEKGFDMLIDAFSKVAKQFTDYSLILYGDGSCLEEYKKQVEELGITDRVFFPGYSNNLAKSLKNEGIFALSSRYEGIPNVLIEALLIGIPTVSFDCTPGGPSYLTHDGERGLIVPLGDVNGLAESIIRLIKDRELYSELEKKGPELMKELEPALIEKKWLDAFSFMLGDNLKGNLKN